MWKKSGVLIFAVLLLSACEAKQQTPVPPGGEPDPVRGEKIYVANCTECHHTDPAETGTLGPAVKGASEELLRARIMEGIYPPGYTPKRDSEAMDPLPELEPFIPDLAAYLR